MRKTVYLLSATSLSLLMMGNLFKIMHWPYGNILLTISLSMISLLTIPLVTHYLYNKRK